MPENNTSSETPVTSVQTSAAPATFSLHGEGMNTTANIMGATPIENQGGPKSSIAIWIGFGLILIAMIVAGTYYFMTMVQPDVTEDIPVVNVPVETDEDRAVRDLETVSAELDASLDFSAVDAELEEVTSDLNTIQ